MKLSLSKFFPELTMKLSLTGIDEENAKDTFVE